MTEQTEPAAEKHPLPEPDDIIGEQNLDRHRDELSPGGRERADKLHLRISRELQALGVTGLGELADHVRRTIVTPDQARGILARLKQLDHIMDTDFPYQLTYEILPRPECPKISRIVSISEHMIAIASDMEGTRSSRVSLLNLDTNLIVRSTGVNEFFDAHDITVLPDGRIASYASNLIWDPRKQEFNPLFSGNDVFRYIPINNRESRTLRYSDGALVFVNGDGPRKGDYDVVYYNPVTGETKAMPLPVTGQIPQILEDITPEGYFLMQKTIWDSAGKSVILKPHASVSAWDPVRRAEIYALPKFPIDPENPPVVIKALPDSSGILIATKDSLRKWDMKSRTYSDINIPAIYSDISDVEVFPPDHRYACVMGKIKVTGESRELYTLLIVDLAANEGIQAYPSGNKVFACTPDGKLFLGGDKMIEMFTFKDSRHE